MGCSVGFILRDGYFHSRAVGKSLGIVGYYVACFRLYRDFCVIRRAYGIFNVYGMYKRSGRTVCSSAEHRAYSACAAV